MSREVRVSVQTKAGFGSHSIRGIESGNPRKHEQICEQFMAYARAEYAHLSTEKGFKIGVIVTHPTATSDDPPYAKLSYPEKQPL